MIRGSLSRRTALGGALGLLVAGALAAPAAHAAPAAPATPAPAVDSVDAALARAIGVPATAAAARVQAEADRATLGATLEKRLGARAAGSYLAPDGSLVVNVLDSATAARVRAAGATARIVTRSSAVLGGITAALNRHVGAAGTAWGVDTATNQVFVSVDSTAAGPKVAALLATAKRYGSAVRVESSAPIRPLIRGGDAIYTGSYRCSLGFNVRNGSGTRFFLTAGHCTNLGLNWYANSAKTILIGPRTGTSFPTNDYGIVRYDNTSISNPGSVNLYNGSTQDITRSGTVFNGQSLCRSGSTTGLRCGSVTATSVTVNYAQGPVYDTIRTNICAEGGDSGGSLFGGSTAYGLTSGGSGNCTFGGTTYFQKVPEALSVYGVNVY